MRRDRVVIALVGSLVLVVGNAVRAEEPVPSADDIARWMSQLSDDAFAVREEASQRLVAAGVAAQAAVREGLEDADAEVRMRCRKILAAIEQREEARLVQAFLHEKDPQKDHGLSGWKPFRKAVGDSLNTRKLFVEMYEAESPLLKAFSDDIEKVNEIFAARMSEIQQSFNKGVVFGGTPAPRQQVPWAQPRRCCSRPATPA